MKSILTLLIAALLIITPLSISQAQTDCPIELIACEELLAECPSTTSCQKICDDKCGWVALVKDKTFMSAVIGGIILLIGGVAGIFISTGS